MSERPGTVALVAALLTLLASSCETAGDGVGADDMVPEPGRPVYEARVWPDPAFGTLEAAWRIQFFPGVGENRPISFLLARDLEILTLEGEGILGYREAPSSFFSGWREVVLELADPSPDRPVALTLTYAGAPAFPPSGINRISTDWVELSVDSGWHPLFTGFDQEMRGVVEVFLPEEWILSGPGTGTYRENRWLLRIDEPQLDVAFVAAPGLRALPGGRVTLLHPGADPAVTGPLLKSADACAEYLDSRYGTEAPLPHTTLVLADRPSNAYARIGHIVLADVEGTQGPTLDRFICHELSHFWSRGADFTTVHHWMTEAFAEYVGARYVREHHGPQAFRDMVEAWERAGEGAGPVWVEGMTARGSDVVMYRRAPALLARLEARIGEAAFDRFLERFMTREVATTPELLGHLVEVAGPAAEQWFRTLLSEGSSAAPSGGKAGPEGTAPGSGAEPSRAPG
jgi:hypothetical protein